MAWVLRLVETGTGGQAESLDVLEISRPSDLRDIASLGLTLPGARQLLARVQQAVVAAQARDHAALRPVCARCGARCQVKDWRSRQAATLFGKVAVRVPRFLCPGCGRYEMGVSWPAHCRSTPELDQLFCQIVGELVSPTLSNLFLHYVFDAWIARNYPGIPFERYADDVICHCRSAKEAQALWSSLEARFTACKLTLHPQKTKLG